MNMKKIEIFKNNIDIIKKIIKICDENYIYISFAIHDKISKHDIHEYDTLNDCLQNIENDIDINNNNLSITIIVYNYIIIDIYDNIVQYNYDVIKNDDVFIELLKTSKCIKSC